jgi:uncharacterized circularly permuted ATP-grasp superfamily protein/uncharacterized alpha-E superfamily protein
MADILGSQISSSQQQGSVVGGSVWNEMTDSRGLLRPHWKSFGQKIQHWNSDERHAIAAAASGMIADLGTTYNVYSDAGGAGQPFQLDPIPLVISPSEWATISAGLEQRIRLIEAVLADLYGPQTLLKDGLVPPDLVHSSPAFLQYARGIQPVGGRFLLTTGCDLVRSANGQWSILKDHTSAVVGLGQVLENRNVASSLLSDHFDSLQVARLSQFFNHKRKTLRSILPARGDMQNVVFLTPGFRHPSYFEDAYRARLMGFPLVEPADLTVRERRLYLKTLSGLRRIDGLASRIEDRELDPLEQWGNGSGAGVPGLIEAWRTGNVALANTPGAGFASSPALMPFLPGICRKWFGEEIKLPFVETWWLSQTHVRRKVLDQLHRYVLLPAFGNEPYLPVRCSNLSAAARKQWISIIEERPYDFVAQLDVVPSEAPALEGRAVRQRPIVWRAYSMNTPEGPIALPGGLARVGKSGQAPQFWAAHAGFTKDVWIPDPTSSLSSKAEVKSPRLQKDLHPTTLEVPSRIAEQLFWVGRCSERIELATRLLRVTLRNFSGEAGRLQQEQLSACLSLLQGVSLLPQKTLPAPTQTLKVLTALIYDPANRGSIPSLTRSLLLNAASARDRLSDDTWRFFNRLEGIVHAPAAPPTASELLRTLDTLVLHLAAFAGMQAENMTRGQGWRFLEVGRRIERALSVLKLLESAAKADHSDSSLLDPVLETCDSVMTYRRRHFSRPRLDAVVDLIFFDVTNPRSVAFQISVIEREISLFSGDPEFGLMPKIREHLLTLDQRFAERRAPDINEFAEIITSLEVFADMITQHYFSHSVRRVY